MNDTTEQENKQEEAGDNEPTMFLAKQVLSIKDQFKTDMDSLRKDMADAHKKDMDEIKKMIKDALND